MQKIYQLQPWKPIQRKWLDRLAKQLTHEGILDHEFINQRFSSDGGSKRLDKLLNNQLDQVITDLNTHLWETA